MDNNEIKKLNLQEFVLYVDSLTTPEFCKWQGIPEPYFTGDVKSSAALFLQIDAIKYRLCKDKAKELSRLASLHLPANLQDFKNWRLSQDVDYVTSKSIFDWFTPYLSKDADEVKELMLDREMLRVSRDICYKKISELTNKLDEINEIVDRPEFTQDSNEFKVWKIINKKS